MYIKSDEWIPVNEHFRIVAGPGAGKTTFLVNHIKNLHKNSKLLSPIRKVACITYTNSGVESINSKLGTEFNLMEISTIHSFLYRHVLKPYGGFLDDEYSLDISKVAGHDDHYVERGKVKQWVEGHPRSKELIPPNTPKQLLRIRYFQLERWLKALRYEKLENNQFILTAPANKSLAKDSQGKKYPLSQTCIEILKSDALNYKKLYWQEGKLDHDDVLFFSSKLIDKYPFILQVLHAKFPYFLIDEFQDSHPLQVELIKRIGLTKTKVGIIGDQAQAIYAFQGADPKQLKEFTLPGIKEYKIKDNHRSKDEIVTVLNYIREDIEQKSHAGKGEKPLIFVGDRHWAYDETKVVCANELKVLYRKNEEVSTMRKKVDYADANLDFLEEFRVKDRSARGRTILDCVEAVELAKVKQFDKAIHKLKYSLRETYDDPLLYRGKALNGLGTLLKEYESYADAPLLMFHELVQSVFGITLSNFQPKKGPHLLYSQYTYKGLAICVEAQCYEGEHITIHQSKGAGFENVLLILDDEKNIDFLIKPDLPNEEEHRVYYVALSRAKKRLFINVPTLSPGSKAQLEAMFAIKYCD